MAEKTKIEGWLNEEDSFSGTTLDEPKSYEKKVVAWIDILGIREKIKNEKDNSAQDIITIMHTLRSFVVQACDQYEQEEKMHSLQIADGVMIASTLDRVNELCEAIATIQWRIFTELKMLSRGAVTIGNVSIADEGTIIIGPAYVEAYALESENAYFARTVVSDAFIDEAKDELRFDYIVEDSDKTKFIDYVGFAQQKEGKTADQMREMLVEKGCLEFVEEKYSDVKLKVAIRQKYGWTIALLEKHKVVR